MISYFFPQNMGIEQGTPVVGSSIDLLHNIDLPDLHLPRAFRAWIEFKLKYEPQIAAIGSLPLNEVAALGDELAISIGQAIGMGVVADQSRGIDRGKVAALSESISGDGNRIIFMRHGEQSLPEWISSIQDPAIRKIRMMQNPFNTQDLLTNKALVDVFLTALGLLYVKEVTGREVHVISSENSRAKEVAGVISTVIPGSTFCTLEGLNSITYKDEKDEPPVSIEKILEDIPSGFMPWEPALVDKLCKDTKSGVKQSEVIVDTISDLIISETNGKGNELYIVLTHNQQLAEVLRDAGVLQDPSMRFPELTMISLSRFELPHVFPRGVLS